MYVNGDIDVKVLLRLIETSIYYAKKDIKRYNRNLAEIDNEYKKKLEDGKKALEEGVIKESLYNTMVKYHNLKRKYFISKITRFENKIKILREDIKFMTHVRELGNEEMFNTEEFIKFKENTLEFILTY